MQPASKSDDTDADGAAAGFLRRLSVADAKVLLERTRKEKEAKTKEMQKMIGVRYRDLIDSADKIVSMHSAAMRLESSLKEMPDKWRDMETKLAETLSGSEKLASLVPDAGVQQEVAKARDTVPSAASVHERVLFIVTAHERLCFHLDRGESKQALALYQQAKKSFESADVQASVSTYPFLPSMWASVHSFEKRVQAVAESCLKSRGKSAQFYAGNLEALHELGCAPGIDELLSQFLKSRTRWLELDGMDNSDEDDEDKVRARAQREMRLNLRSLLLTILQVDAIFLSDDSSLINLRGSPSAMIPLDKYAIQTVAETWFSKSLESVTTHASSIIGRIHTIAEIAQTQNKLAGIEAQYAAYRETSLWKSLQSSHAAPSMFQLLFGKALRKRTRDLVQHSFVDATNAIKRDIKACLGVVAESIQPLRQLPTVQFYEYFDSIHKKVVGLDSSELQRVLTEEYMRSLLAITRFLEDEYPWFERSTEGPQNPVFLLGLTNILISIVTTFPDRKKTLFGDGVEKDSKGHTISDDVKKFELSSQNGRLGKEALLEALKRGQGDRVKGSSFIDEEIQHIESAGFYSFRLLSQITSAAPHSSVFVEVLRGLAEKYCEAWARRLLHQKIGPLRGFLQTQRYDLTNEQWVSTHQGWSEQVIVTDELSGDDEDPSEDGGLSTEEKVWLPWSETPTVSSFLFSCCYALDEAYQLVRRVKETVSAHVNAMHELIRLVLTEQLTIMSVDVYDEALDLVVKAKGLQSRAVLNFGEFCVLQFLFDMYFVRATLGFSDFVRFGWGDDIDLATCAPSVARLKKLFERMHDFVDPVDWEIYGPQLIENVVIQFRKSRLLFSSLSEANDINEINGKPIVVSAQDTRPIIKLAEPVPRFSLLPVPTTRRRAPSVSSSTPATNGSRSASSASDSLFHENTPPSSLPSLKLQDLLAGTTSSNLLSSAAKGMSFISSATSSYLREGASSDASRSKYF